MFFFPSTSQTCRDSPFRPPSCCGWAKSPSSADPALGARALPWVCRCSAPWGRAKVRLGPGGTWHLSIFFCVWLKATKNWLEARCFWPTKVSLCTSLFVVRTPCAIEFQQTIVQFRLHPSSQVMAFGMPLDGVPVLSSLEIAPSSSSSI